ncbi:hypothetical protein B484DRAFT_46227 [Ochromonadaceae sp. CCMP2298]|nr:hypothetical protein B484DRAFT_46227 [Ochromonadaceae sp. CCMP2298]
MLSLHRCLLVAVVSLLISTPTATADSKHTTHVQHTHGTDTVHSTQSTQHTAISKQHTVQTHDKQHSTGDKHLITHRGVGTSLVAGVGGGDLGRRQGGPSMLQVNTLMLLFYATLGSAMPYLPLYYKSLGVSDNDLGLLGAVTPAVTFFVSPLWGMLADTKGHYRILLLTFASSVAARCLLAYVPLLGRVPKVPVLGHSKVSVPVLGLIVAVSAVLYAPVKPLLDSAVLGILEDKSAYGKSRLFGQIGFGMGSFLVGPLLGRFKLMFLAHGLIAVPTTMLMASFGRNGGEVRGRVRGRGQGV